MNDDHFFKHEMRVVPAKNGWSLKYKRDWTVYTSDTLLLEAVKENMKLIRAATSEKDLPTVL